jgi:hypothetical protein
MPRTRQVPIRKVPDSFQLMDLFKLLRVTETGAKGTAWGSIGSVFAHLAGATAAKFHGDLLLPERELISAGFVIALAVYILISRSNTGVRRCLGFAEIMFAEGKISAPEYRSMKGSCLKRAGLIGK